MTWAVTATLTTSWARERGARRRGTGGHLTDCSPPTALLDTGTRRVLRLHLGPAAGWLKSHLTWRTINKVPFSAGLRTSEGTPAPSTRWPADSLCPLSDVICSVMVTECPAGFPQSRPRLERHLQTIQNASRIDAYPLISYNLYAHTSFNSL